MWRDELGLLFGRLRTRVLLLVLAAIPAAYAVSVKLAGTPPRDGPPFLGQALDNGLFAGVAGLTTVAQAVLPLIVAVIAGDAIAGEADLGTLRYLLIAPVSRPRLLGVKLTGVFVFTLAGALVVAASGLLFGAVLFQLGPVPTALGAADPKPDATLLGPTLSLGAAVLRLLLAALVVAVQLFGFAAAGVFLSTLTRIPIGAIVATGGLLAIGTVLQSAVSFLKPIQPWVFNTHWDAFATMFHAGQPWADIGRSIGVSGLYTVVFAAAAWLRLRHTDVTG